VVVETEKEDVEFYKDYGEYYECSRHGKWPKVVILQYGQSFTNWVCPECANEIEQRREYLESGKCEKWERKYIVEICNRGETRRFTGTMWIIREKATGKPIEKGFDLDEGTPAEAINWIRAAEREAKSNVKLIEVAQ